MVSPASAQVVLPGEESYGRVLQFLYEEAALLDSRRFEDWLDLLADDIVYVAPIPVNDSAEAPGFAADGHYFYEDIGSLRQRVQRLRTGYAWAEDPPSRTCHLLSNVRVERVGDEIVARSTFLVYRCRGDSAHPDLLAGERRDTLRPADPSFRLARREVFLAQSVLGVPSLSFFF